MNRAAMIGCVAVCWAVWVSGGWAAEQFLLEDEGLEAKIHSFQAERAEGERLPRAKAILAKHRLSSLQVKAIAERLPDDTARFQFALSAFPRTVDPENFYEVYDAFHSLSKVMRLHDQIAPHGHGQGRPVPVPPVVQPPSAEELKSILQAIRKESFDNNRIQLARQIFTSGGRKFLAAQVKQMVECLDFENGKLELAKFAYDYVLDREQFFVVNDAFTFAASRESLSKYVQSKQGQR